MPRVPRTPHQAIVDVLTSARVASDCANDQIAEAILHAFAVCRIDISTEHDRRAAAELQERMAGPSWHEQLHYIIKVEDQAGNTVEVLGREFGLDPARTAYRMYIEKYPDKLILLCNRGQLLRRSDLAE